jgi:hypothetical protein
MFIVCIFALAHKLEAFRNYENLPVIPWGSCRTWTSVIDQEVSWILYMPKVRHHLRKDLSLGPILRKMNPVTCASPTFLRSILILSSNLTGYSAVRLKYRMSKKSCMPYFRKFWTWGKKVSYSRSASTLLSVCSVNLKVQSWRESEYRLTGLVPSRVMATSSSRS